MFISCLCHFLQSHSSLFCLDKLMNCKLASIVFLISNTQPHTHTAVLPCICVSLLPWMFSVTVVFKLHFLCLRLLRQALSPELHEDRIDTASAVKTSVCICLEEPARGSPYLCETDAIQFCCCKSRELRAVLYTETNIYLFNIVYFACKHGYIINCRHCCTK